VRNALMRRYAKMNEHKSRSKVQLTVGISGSHLKYGSFGSHESGRQTASRSVIETQERIQYLLHGGICALVRVRNVLSEAGTPLCAVCGPGTPPNFIKFSLQRSKRETEMPM